MDNILRGLDFVRCYVDDLIVVSHSHEEHVKHLGVVFDILRKHNLTINRDKCHFGKSEVTYLGYVVNRSGYRPPVDKMEAISTYPKPDTISDLRRYIGMLNYYRCCIPHAAEMQAPLCTFLKDAKKKDKRKIPWTPLTEECFQACRDSIVAAARTAFLSPTAQLSLTTDASDVALGAALEQKVDDGWMPLGFFSRKLTSAETRYSTYDRELLAIFSTIKYFKHILEGRPFIVRTDHRPLVYAFAQRLDKASPRQQRHLDFISQYTTEILYVKGEDTSLSLSNHSPSARKPSGVMSRLASCDRTFP